MATEETKAKMLAIVRQLYPTGRAFRMAEGTWLEALNLGLVVSEAQAYEDAVSIELSLIPDNNSFTADDATIWEQRLGLPVNSLTALTTRKEAILRKMSFPGRNPARSSRTYLEGQLRAAGFDVYVHENIPEQDPSDLNSSILSVPRYGDELRYGIHYGEYHNAIIANHITNDGDIYFDHGDNFKCAFFIGGQTLGTYATVAVSREMEFRQIVLRIKPVQTIAYLFINYT